MTIFWDVVSCSLVEISWYFRGAHWLHPTALHTRENYSTRCLENMISHLNYCFLGSDRKFITCIKRESNKHTLYESWLNYCLRIYFALSTAEYSLFMFNTMSTVYFPRKSSSSNYLPPSYSIALRLHYLSTDWLPCLSYLDVSLVPPGKFWDQTIKMVTTASVSFRIHLRKSSQ